MPQVRGLSGALLNRLKIHTQSRGQSRPRLGNVDMGLVKGLGFRIGSSPRQSMAHRYALGIAGVSSVIRGVKNRSELQECLRSEQMGKLFLEETATLGLCIPANNL